MKLRRSRAVETGRILTGAKVGDASLDLSTQTPQILLHTAQHIIGEAFEPVIGLITAQLLFAENFRSTASTRPRDAVLRSDGAVAKLIEEYAVMLLKLLEARPPSCEKIIGHFHQS